VFRSTVIPVLLWSFWTWFPCPLNTKSILFKKWKKKYVSDFSINISRPLVLFQHFSGSTDAKCISDLQELLSPIHH
jgi:hypothetical protein